MKSSKFDIDEDSKKRKSAANHFPTSSMMSPPAFAPNASSNMQMGSGQMAQSSATNNIDSQAKEPQSSSSSHDNQPDDDKKDDISKTFSTIKPHDMYDAVTNAHGYFKQTSRLTNVRIQGPTALGGPGCLQGMGLKTMIMADSNMAGQQGANKHMVKAMSNVMDDVFETWKNTFVIPNLPWYPAFAMFPGPVTPPIPNIPMPMIMASFNNYLLSNASFIAQRIMQELPSEMRNSVNAETVETFSTMITSYFDMWFMTQYMTNVLGQGTVPGWNPMIRPVGPVYGNVLSTPGILV